MYNALLGAHSGLRWLLVISLVIALIKATIGWLGNKKYTKIDNIVALALVSFTHIMAILGLVLYFVSPQVTWTKETMGNSLTRFWSMEHGLIMLIVVVLITIGRVKSKKATTDLLKHKKGAIFYIIAFVLILWAGIMKPYLLGNGWI
tara:strand:+ start:4600 stop:5040 length:441 start_codon:yes stop_codon:yes gene_type:complete